MSADLLLGLPAKVKKLLDRLTETRAAYLDNLTRLDVIASTRAPATDTGTLLGRLTATRAANLDLIGSQVIAGAITGRYNWGLGSEQIGQIGKIPEDHSSVAGIPFASFSTPSNIFYEAMNLAGPGYLGYLGFHLDTSYGSVTVYHEMEINGSLISAGYSSIQGTPVGGLTEISSLIGGFAKSPVVIHSTFETNVILRLKCSSVVSGDVRFIAHKL